jgi:hypothetical protein
MLEVGVDGDDDETYLGTTKDATLGPIPRHSLRTSVWSTITQHTAAT